MYEKIRQTVFDSGLWKDGRESSHGFVLSPSVYEVSQEKRSQLEAMGAALYDCLAGLGRIAAIASDPKLGHGAWGMIKKALRGGVLPIYHNIMLHNPDSVPRICKVDLMESTDGNFYIAEIDGHNKHGLGYSTLTARIRRLLMPEAREFPGVATILAQEVQAHGKNTIVLIYTDRERFYLPEFCILQSELTTYGVELAIIAEGDMHIHNGSMTVHGDHRDHTLFIDLPILCSQSLHALLAELYGKGEVDFLIPPKPFLGSKAILALLRNDIDNAGLEAILRSQISLASLELLRQHIPETYLVYKRAGAEEHWRTVCGNGGFVLKESISSGMKGTIFTDESDFDAMLKRACGLYYAFVLQKEVTNCPHSLRYFTDTGCLRQSEWFIRAIVHYTLHGIADIVVTARPDRKVHGARDSIQLGAIIKKGEIS